MSLLLLCIFASSVFNYLQAARYPSEFPKCSRNDPNLDECLRNTLQVAFSIASKKGIPEMDIPKLDPMEVPEIVIETQGEAVKVKQRYYDIKFYGFGGSVVTKTHLDKEKSILTYSMFTPNFTQISPYDIEGKILILPVYGNGTAKLTAKNCTLDYTMTFGERTTKTVTFYNITDFNVDWRLEGIDFDLENLFNGNKELSDNTLQTLNENWETVFEDIKPGFEKAYGSIVRNVAQRFFSLVPAKEIFLD